MVEQKMTYILSKAVCVNDYKRDGHLTCQVQFPTDNMIAQNIAEGAQPYCLVAIPAFADRAYGKMVMNFILNTGD